MGLKLAAMSQGRPTLIVLDTATDRVHAALVARGHVQAVVAAGAAQASATLLPSLSRLLSDAGLAWPDVDAIGFGSGPGAFTGLRTACSTAQGLAMGLNKPVLSLDTLMAVAEDARQSAPHSWTDGDEVWVLQDARMEEMYVAAFAWQGGRWACTQAPALWALDQPQARWAASAPKHLAGSALQAYPDRFLDVAAAHTWPQAAPQGAALAALGLAAWQRGDTLDAAWALPRYVRDKVAQTTAERQAQRK